MSESQQEDQVVDHESSLSILNDRGALQWFYSEVSSNLRFIVDKVWENAKFFTTLTSALLTFSAAALAKGWLDKSRVNQDPVGYLLLAVVPLLVIMIAFIGTRNLYREYRRFLDWMTVMAKIQERLGLHEEIETRIYPEDSCLLPKHFVKHSHLTSESFVNEALAAKGSLYYYFRLLHITYAAVALLLMALMLWLGLGG